MSAVPAAPKENPHGLMEKVLLDGDLSKLSIQERLNYYVRTCESLGLNPMTQPFSYLRLNNKLVLYANRNCTDQLRSVKTVSIEIKSREFVEGVYIVTATAKMPDGRTDESIGAVNIENLKGEMKANAIMRCETKAKRRVTLSICGLSMLDETEVETIPGAQKVAQPLPSKPVEVLERFEQNKSPPPAAAQATNGGTVGESRAVGPVFDDDTGEVNETIDRFVPPAEVKAALEKRNLGPWLKWFLATLDDSEAAGWSDATRVQFADCWKIEIKAIKAHGDKNWTALQGALESFGYYS